MPPLGRGYRKIIRVDPDSASRSPARALNAGIAEARGGLVGVMIDGARLASPGLLSKAQAAARLHAKPMIGTIAFHLGPKVQMQSVREGYDQAAEDRLLAQSSWEEDGYRLFSISSLAGSSSGGWFELPTESNAVFLRPAHWRELGGFDERFATPGGGLVNLDTWSRICADREGELIVLLGEATFHQIHGGIATNNFDPPKKLFHEEYTRIRGRRFTKPTRQPLYFGSLPDAIKPSLKTSLDSCDVDQARQLDMGDNQHRVQFHLAQARAHRSRGETELAQAEYRKAIELESDLVEAHIGLSELRMPGEGYLRWLERLHAALVPESYLEIGIGRGASLACARPPTLVIAVDPKPAINAPLKTETHIYCETSDVFFAQQRLAPLLNGRPLVFAFIDGLHHFHQALKDFVNIERFCGPRSVVLFHDTIPFDERTQRTKRELKFYTGDVWKTVLCLKHYRPDLDVFTIPTPWSGLTMVTGLDPSSRVLSDNYDNAVAHFTDFPFADLMSGPANALNIIPQRMGHSIGSVGRPRNSLPFVVSSHVTHLRRAVAGRSWARETAHHPK